eukprot:CAMPEP_0172719114 /NCGR_PEP_ID=MMETSP1074-20121228/75319_1 /TAXON_ID=2916 /ORGANISM="Ceratium fusus, Strain PA161109" /LENGTH=216 /DNA_ID=CAMNT_0013544433 /DNA_START=52 /DNA_END=703 /DNA_ORIENTATION=+
MHSEVANGGGPTAQRGTPMGGQYMSGPQPDMPLLTGRPPRQEGHGFCDMGNCRYNDCVGFEVDDEYGEDAQLSYVGNGRGKYMQETTYKFVGKGAGNFDDVGVPSKAAYHRSTVDVLGLAYAGSCRCFCLGRFCGGFSQPLLVGGEVTKANMIAKQVTTAGKKAGPTTKRHGVAKSFPVAARSAHMTAMLAWTTGTVAGPMARRLGVATPSGSGVL